MRCRFCGSKSLHEDTQRKNFSTGKAVVGAVTFGVVGAAAGLIGKDQKGYRCGACGQFMETPMDLFTEGQVDTAIRDAESGRSRTMFDYYHNQYANIQANFPAVLPSPTSAPAQEMIYQPMIAEPAGSSLKRSYRYGYWNPDCPIWVEGVLLKTDAGGDKLSLAAWNLGSATVRSVYFLVKVFDDTGDQVSECRCVYQGLSIPRGGKLPEEKEFHLNTELAYRVELTCEKAAFEGDEVWRQKTESEEISLPDQPVLSSENFPRLKYANPNYAAVKTEKEQFRMPVQADGVWLCCCGAPVREGQQCPRCGDTWEHVELCFSQLYLMERQQKAVRERAAKRASELDARLQHIKQQRQKQEEAEKNAVYAQAQKLQSRGKPADLRAAAEKYGEISGWQDADEQAKACLTQAHEIEERERAEKAARQEREAQETAARKRRIKKIAMIVVPIVIACIAFVIVLTQVIIPESQYKAAEQLLADGKYDEAKEAFEALGDYKDSNDRASDTMYKKAADLFTAEDFDGAYMLFYELGEYKDSQDQATLCINAKAYSEAMRWKAAGYYLKAMQGFSTILAYSDSETQMTECQALAYDEAKELEAQGNNTEALSIYSALGNYKDSRATAYRLRSILYPYIVIRDYISEHGEAIKDISRFVSVGFPITTLDSVYGTSYVGAGYGVNKESFYIVFELTGKDSTAVAYVAYQFAQKTSTATFYVPAVGKDGIGYTASAEFQTADFVKGYTFSKNDITAELDSYLTYEFPDSDKESFAKFLSDYSDLAVQQIENLLAQANLSCTLADLGLVNYK